MNNAKERPIVLTAQEVNAVLAGDKTQQRVIVERNKDTQPLFSSCAWYHLWCDDLSGHKMERVSRVDHQPMQEYVSVGHCPFGKVGDRLWVQEPTLAIEYVGWIGPVFVASDDGRNAIDWGYGPYDDPAHIPACELTYNNPCDLSREDSRLLLKVADIRIERLKEVSEEDAIAQGVKRQGESWVNYKFLTDSHCAIDARTSFATFWQSNNGDNSWDLNPWVWVIDFKLIENSEVNTNGND